MPKYETVKDNPDEVRDNAELIELRRPEHNSEEWREVRETGICTAQLLAKGTYCPAWKRGQFRDFDGINVSLSIHNLKLAPSLGITAFISRTGFPEAIHIGYVDFYFAKVHQGALSNGHYQSEYRVPFNLRRGYLTRKDTKGKPMTLRLQEEVVLRALSELSRPGDGNRVHLRILLDDTDRQSIEVGGEDPLNTILTAIPKAMKKHISNPSEKSDPSQPSQRNVPTAPERAITRPIFYPYMVSSGLPQIQYSSLFKPKGMITDGHPSLPLQKTDEASSDLTRVRCP